MQICNVLYQLTEGDVVMKKVVIGLLTFVFIFIAFTGCSASKTPEDNDSRMLRNEFPAEGFSDMEMARSAYNLTETKDAVLIDFGKKLIKTADVVIETKDVVGTYQSILDFAKENGGYEFSQTTNIREDNTTIVATIKIVPENLDMLVHFAGTKGSLISSRVDSEDITDNYFDSEIRLESLRGQLEKYKEFLTSAKTIDETITVQSYIDSLIEEIELLEGRLSKWDRQVAESTVIFQITQKADPSLKRREINWSALSFSDMGYLISSGFVSVINVIVSALQWVFIGVLVISPLWLPVLIVLLIVFRKKIALRRARRKEKKMEREQQG